MSILSNRAKGLKPSPTLAINAKAKAMQAQGIRVVSFGAGEPDFDTPPDALLVDVRRDRSVLSMIGAIKRRYPSMGIAIVAKSLDSELMLESMRAGVSEAIPEPLTAAAKSRPPSLRDWAPRWCSMRGSIA